jgi:hypothetical protein
MERVLSLYKSPQRNRELARDQFDPPWQRHHMKLLAWNEPELVTHPLGDHDLMIGRNSGDINRFIVI